MEEKDLQLLEVAKEHVLSTAKWMKFLAILGCIGAVFMILCGICVMTFSGVMDFGFYDGIPGGSYITIFMSIFYLIMAGIYIYPIICLLRASKAAQMAVATNSNEQMVEFLSNNKSFWKFCGILTIVMLALSVLMLIVAPIAVAFSVM